MTPTRYSKNDLVYAYLNGGLHLTLVDEVLHGGKALKVMYLGVPTKVMSCKCLHGGRLRHLPPSKEGVAAC